MGTSRLTARELRQRSQQLSTILREWDPLGVMDAPDWPRDEYDSLVSRVLSDLQRGASELEPAGNLRLELVENFGVKPDQEDLLGVTRRVREWYDLAWGTVTEPVTVYVALLGEAVDVWRPVPARPLGGGRYRLLDVEADVRTEAWQFAPGAVVRCEPADFENSRTELRAVELVRHAD